MQHEFDDQPVTVVVLAGGLSRRLGQDKRRLRLWGADGPTLLEHTVALVGRLCAEVVVVLNDPAAWPTLPARLVPDVYPDGGALGGIYAGLLAAQQPYALVVAADMPTLNRDLLRAMLRRPRTYDVLVPRAWEASAARNTQHVEPLHAIYSRACVEPVRGVLDSGRRAITALLPLVRVEYVEVEEAARYDPQGRSFANVNTPAELAEARHKG